MAESQLDILEDRPIRGLDLWEIKQVWRFCIRFLKGFRLNVDFYERSGYSLDLVTV